MKKLVVTALANRIVFADVKTDKNGRPTEIKGERVDVTESALEAVLEYCANELKDSDAEYFVFRKEGMAHQLLVCDIKDNNGSIIFVPAHATKEEQTNERED